MLGLGILDVSVAGPLSGGTPPVTAPVEGASIFVAQVAPVPHPGPFFNAGIQGPNVGTPSIGNRALTLQEQPWHPQPFRWYGVQGPDAIVPVTSLALIRQEQPWHPGPIFRWNQPFNVAAPGQIVDHAITVQEQPWQPLWPRPPITRGNIFVTRIGSAKGYII